MFAKLSGRFLHRLTALELLTPELKAKLFKFFKRCLATDENKEQDLVEERDSDLDADLQQLMQNQESGFDSLVTLAVYNVPCFFKHAPALSDDGKELLKQNEILSLLLSVIKDKSAVVPRRIVATSFHELLAHKTNHTSLSLLHRIFGELIAFAQSEPQLITALCGSMEKTCQSFLANCNLGQYLLSLAGSKQVCLTAPEESGFAFLTVEKENPKTPPEVKTPDRSPGRSPVRSPSRHSSERNLLFSRRLEEKLADDSDDGIIFMPNSRGIERHATEKQILSQNAESQKFNAKTMGDLPKKLHKLVPINFIPSRYFSEIASSRLLDQLVQLLKVMVAKPGHCRRDLEQFLTGISNTIGMFNAQ